MAGHLVNVKGVNPVNYYCSESNELVEVYDKDFQNYLQKYYGHLFPRVKERGQKSAYYFNYFGDYETCSISKKLRSQNPFSRLESLRLLRGWRLVKEDARKGKIPVQYANALKKLRIPNPKISPDFFRTFTDSTGEQFIHILHSHESEKHAFIKLSDLLGDLLSEEDLELSDFKLPNPKFSEDQNFNSSLTTKQNLRLTRPISVKKTNENPNENKKIVLVIVSLLTIVALLAAFVIPSAELEEVQKLGHAIGRETNVFEAEVLNFTEVIPSFQESENDDVEHSTVLDHPEEASDTSNQQFEQIAAESSINELRMVR